MKKLIKIFSTLFACSVLAFSISACTDNTATQSGNDFSSTHTHEYTATVTSPTCIEQGYTTHTCTCGDEYVDSYVNATNHNFMYYVYDNNATCTANGTETATCDNANCSETDTRVKANTITAHNIDDLGWCNICDQDIAPVAGVIYALSADGTYAEAIGLNGDNTEIVISPTYHNLPVKSIRWGAFKETDITSVIIPDSVTSIGLTAFYNCDSLTTVAIGNGVTSIDHEAFFHCNSLTNVTIGNSVTSIGVNAFRKCTKLAKVTIPDSVNHIGQAAFYDCNSLTNVTIGNGITSIDHEAFYNCDKLQFNVYKNCNYLGNDDNPYLALINATNKNFSSYEIHENTKVIAALAFNQLSNLTEIVIPDGIIAIDDFTFSGCNNLTTVSIPNSVTSIGECAFSRCSSLVEITIPDSVTSIHYRVFNECANLTSIIFENPIGWIGTFYNSTYEIPIETLSDSAMAAQYLVKDYPYYTYQRTE